MCADMKKKSSGSRKSFGTDKSPSRLLIDAVRKPVPPPTAPHGEAKPAERAYPANRKTKHKKPDAEDGE